MHRVHVRIPMAVVVIPMCGWFSGGGSLGSSAGEEEVVSWPISLKDSQARSSKFSHIERYTYRVFNLDRNTRVYFMFRERKEC